jgi:hypothetical protein
VVRLILRTRDEFTISFCGIRPGEITVGIAHR